MKFEKFVSKLLANKYVLYIVSVLAILSVMGYMIMGKFQAVLVFILIGCIMTYFSKNMIIILLTPLVFTSLLISVSRREGFATKTSGAGTANSATGAIAPQGTGSKAAATSNSTTPSRDTEIAGTDAIESVSPSVEGGDVVVESDYGDFTGDINGDNTGHFDDGFEVGRKNQNRLDYGSTLEAAYEDLNKALGSDGIRRLTDDTQRLMKQQLELADAMKGMTPMLKQAQDMLKSLNITELGDVTSLIKQMGGTSIMKPQTS
jgi:hypothetical protein